MFDSQKFDVELIDSILSLSQIEQNQNISQLIITWYDAFRKIDKVSFHFKMLTFRINSTKED